MFDRDDFSIVMAKEDKSRERKIVHSLEEIPGFNSEGEEREGWGTHDLAGELGEEVTEEHHALIRRLKVKYRYAPVHAATLKAK